MQTFLPYPDFAKSAAALDNRRLGKQRVEVLQILKALSGETEAWQNHPAVKMWCGHEYSLVTYSLVICNEWVKRGYKDTCTDKILSLGSKYFRIPDNIYTSPAFDTQLNLSHQSNLIRKDPTFYGPKFPGIPSDLPYVWPV